jgi:hypothetical protein
MRRMTAHTHETNHGRMESQATAWRVDGWSPLVEEIADLVDEMLFCLVQWREAASLAGDAYKHWCAAPAAEKAARFGAYISALDQEAAAAISYGEAVAEIGVLWRRAREYEESGGN